MPPVGASKSRCKSPVSRGTGKSEGPATLVWSPFPVEQFCKWFGPETAVDEMRYSAQSMNVQTASGNACEVHIIGNFAGEAGFGPKFPETPFAGSSQIAYARID
jgi:hypothetical protein